MSRNGKEVLYEGWLTKSPPTKRIWRARWRKRWFALQSGELPSQYLLTYYTDRNCRKLKGVIDLDNCEQVDTGLKYEDKKLKFDYMFDIKTPTRTYYLAADNENEMKAWVKCICDILGLKATMDDQQCKHSISVETSDVYFKELTPEEITIDQSYDKSLEKSLESPPTSASSGPYIPISECITGKSPTQGAQDFYTLLHHNIKNSYFRPDYSKGLANDTYDTAPTYLNDIVTHSEGDPRFYDSPRPLQVPKAVQKASKNSSDKIEKSLNSSPLQSPTDSESVFTDDDWTHNTLSSTNSGAKVTHPSDSSASDIIHKISKLSVDVSSSSPLPPPRPPKPAHITPGPTYTNLSESTCPLKAIKETIDDQQKGSGDGKGLSDEMYDFPRSHQLESGESMPSTLSRRHCYNNAAPVTLEGQIFRYDISPKPCTSSTSSAQVFRYDSEDIADEPASPVSQSSSSTVAIYSNLPSPLLPDSQLMPPPKINRNLKPKRKLSDAQSICSTEPSSPHQAPSVDRTLKPITVYQGMVLRKPVDCDTDKIWKVRAAPSPTPPDLNRIHDSVFSDSEDMYHSFYIDTKSNSGDLSMLQYLDLDHNTSSDYSNSTTKSQPLKSPSALTVYKKVDFMKTQAFKLTRQDLESERQSAERK